MATHPGIEKLWAAVSPQARVPDGDKAPLLDAPITKPGHTFGSRGGRGAAVLSPRTGTHERVGVLALFRPFRPGINRCLHPQSGTKQALLTVLLLSLEPKAATVHSYCTLLAICWVLSLCQQTQGPAQPAAPAARGVIRPVAVHRGGYNKFCHSAQRQEPRAKPQDEQLP
ncbi:UNVERIFIED_CONTAM: hypothetical protein FKN15_068944 [Acipenser sinensis]